MKIAGWIFVALVLLVCIVGLGGWWLGGFLERPWWR